MSGQATSFITNSHTVTARLMQALSEFHETCSPDLNPKANPTFTCIP